MMLDVSGLSKKKKEKNKLQQTPKFQSDCFQQGSMNYYIFIYPEMSVRVYVILVLK